MALTYLCHVINKMNKTEGSISRRDCV